MGIFTKLAGLFGAKQTPSEKESAAPVDQTAAYIAAIEAERSQKDAFFRMSPYSPIDIEERHAFPGLKHYSVNPDLRFTLPLEPAPREEITIQTNTGEARPFIRLGTVSFTVEGESGQLAVYRGVDQEELFVPFKDATNGTETYGAGRYLEPMALADGTILLDFNVAYNPYCAYSENYSCPLPPAENRLTIPIRAGEMAFK